MFLHCGFCNEPVFSRVTVSHAGTRLRLFLRDHGERLLVEVKSEMETK